MKPAPWSRLSLATLAVLRDASHQLAMTELDPEDVIAYRQMLADSSAYLPCKHLRADRERRRRTRRI